MCAPLLGFSLICVYVSLFLSLLLTFSAQVGPAFIVEQLKWAKSVSDRLPVLKQHFPAAAFDEIMNEARELVPSSVAELLQVLKADLARYFRDDDSKAVKQERAHFYYTGNDHDLRRAQALIQEALTLTEEKKLAGFSASSVQLRAGRARVIPPHIIEDVQQPMKDVLDVSEDGSVSPAKSMPVAKETASAMNGKNKKQQAKQSPTDDSLDRMSVAQFLKDIPDLCKGPDRYTAFDAYFAPARVRRIRELQADIPQLPDSEVFSPVTFQLALRNVLAASELVKQHPRDTKPVYWALRGLQLAHVMTQQNLARFARKDRLASKSMVMTACANCLFSTSKIPLSLNFAVAEVLDYLQAKTLDEPEFSDEPEIHALARLQFYLADALTDSASTALVQPDILSILKKFCAPEQSVASQDSYRVGVAMVQQAVSAGNQAGTNDSSTFKLLPSRVDPSMLRDDPVSAVSSGDKRVRTDEPEQLESPAKKTKQ